MSKKGKYNYLAISPQIHYINIYCCKIWEKHNVEIYNEIFTDASTVNQRASALTLLD